MNGVADRRIQLLRPLEQLCYQVAYYLLDHEGEAAAASEDALLTLYRMPAWERLTDEERTRMAKDTAIRCALKRGKERNK